MIKLNKKAKSRWYELDNVAKIFPPSSTKQDPRVFRFSAELYENVEASILEEAVEETLKQFPDFKVVLKRGFFWYYLESTEKTPIIKEEKIPPCSPLYRKSSKKLLFRIHYYQKRINLEVYHALADGTGALHFLETILIFYLVKRYPQEYKDKKVEIPYDASSYEKMDDSFKKYYKITKNKKKNRNDKSYQFTGDKIKSGHLKIIEGTMSVRSVLTLSRAHGSTITSLMTAAYVFSIYKNMKEIEKTKPIRIMVPVNLRNFFTSASARNFFCTVEIEALFKKKNVSFEDVVKIMNKAFDRELQPKNIEARMNGYSKLEKNFMARLTPLFIKDIVLKFAARLEGGKTTSVVTNIGKITLPSIYQKHVRLFDVLVSTGKVQMAICSYLDTLMVTFTSSFINNDIIKDFYRTLTDLGIEVTIVTNKIEG